MKTLTNPFFIMMEEGVRKAEKEFGCTVIVQAAEEETSIEQLIGIVESMIAKKVDAICVTPSGSTEVIPVFLKAAKAGIPIIDVDVEIDKAAAKAAGLKYHYVGADNFQGGYMAGKALAVALKGKGKVAILEGIPGVDNAEKRKGGALKAFKEYPGIKVVASQTAHWKTEEALNVFTNILQANPDLAGVFCANDMMAFGAINAIEAAGKGGKILVASYDALDAAKVAIKDGTMLCSIDQRPDLMGYYGVKFALDRLAGKDVPDVFMVPLTNITKANVK
jgi:ribose transport system substrate-binding protein